MRMNIVRGLFHRPIGFITTDDGETMCTACGALVRHQHAHRDFHEALQQIARDLDQVEATAQRPRW